MGRLLLLFKYSKYGTPSILGLLFTQKRFPSLKGTKAFLLISAAGHLFWDMLMQNRYTSGTYRI